MRLFVLGFLLLFVAVAGVEANLWPLTSWQLFSRVRGPTQAGWEAVVVDGAGYERAVPFRGPFPARQSACRRGIEWAREAGIDAVAVRVYRTQSTVSLDSSPPTTVRTRELRYTC